MDSHFSKLSSLPVYSLNNTRWSVDLAYCQSSEKVYFCFVKASAYKNDGKDKNSMNFVLYIVPAAESLLKILPVAITEAMRFKGVRLYS